MARDRPSPYGEGGGVFFTVARGPSDATRASERVSPAIIGVREAWRGTGPRPTVKGRFSPPVARGPVPRDRCMARACPSPYDEGGAFFP